MTYGDRSVESCSNSTYDSLLRTIYGLLTLVASSNYPLYCCIIEDSLDLIAGVLLLR